MLQDVRHGFRLLLQSKGWTLVVLISLALGIGANATIFSAVNQTMLRQLPVEDPDSLVRLQWYGENDMANSLSEYGSGGRTPGGEELTSTFSHPAYEDLRDASPPQADLAAVIPSASVNLIVNGEAESARVESVSGNFFEVTGVGAAAGRLLTPADDDPAAPAVAVLSHGYWMRRFGGSADTIGRTVTMNGRAVTIVGVIEQGFTGVLRPDGTPRDVTIPLALYPSLTDNTSLGDPTNWRLLVIGRLKPDVAIAQLQASLAGVFQQSARAGWESHYAALPAETRLEQRYQNRTAVPQLYISSGSRGIYVLSDSQIRNVAILSAIAVSVLLIVCANVANLLLSRTAARHKEITVRLSMGATRARIIRQLLTESLMLAIVGGGLGLVVAYWSRALLPFGQDPPIDLRVIGFAAGLSMLTGFGFGLVPAWRASRDELAVSLKEGSRTISRSRSLLSRGLLVLQVAVSVVLIVGAGLFLRTLANVRSVDVGFNTENLLMFDVAPALNGYEGDRLALFYDQLQAELRAIPGVRSVALTRNALLAGSTSVSMMYPAGSSDGQRVYMMTASPEFFGTLEIPIVLGRGFERRDDAAAPKVAVINQTAANDYFAGRNPIGQRVGFSPEQADEFEIIGVIGDTRYSSLRQPAPPTLYRAWRQQEIGFGTVVVRTAAAPAGLFEAVRQAIRRVDPALPLPTFTTQAEQLALRATSERVFATAYSLFGGLALVLAGIGLFGLMSHSVARRTNEIGIRMALGASRGAVVRMVLVESLVLAGIGIVCGIAGALGLGRLIASLLFGVEATDPATMAAAVAVMAAVSTLSAYLPASRAARVDPLVALRYE